METNTKDKEVEKLIPSVLENRFAQLTDRWADRLPGWLSPNQITAVGLIAGLLGAVCFALGGVDRRLFLGAILGIVCHLVADNFDGFFARKWNKASSVGAFYDIVSDVLVTTVCLIGIGLGGYANYRIVLFAVPLYGIFIIIALHSIFLLRVFPFPRMGPFELHVSFVIVALLNFAFGTVTIAFWGLHITLTDMIILGGLFIEVFELTELSAKLIKGLKRG